MYPRPYLQFGYPSNHIKETWQATMSEKTRNIEHCQTICQLISTQPIFFRKDIQQRKSTSHVSFPLNNILKRLIFFNESDQHTHHVFKSWVENNNINSNLGISRLNVFQPGIQSMGFNSFSAKLKNYRKWH